MATIENSIKDFLKEPRNIQDLKDILNEKIADTPIRDLFTVRTGVKTGDRVMASRQYHGLLKKRPDVTKPSYKSLSDIEKGAILQTFDMTQLNFDASMHISELKPSFMDYMTRNSIKEADLRESNNHFLDFFTEKLLQAIEMDLIRLAFMGDENIASKNVLYVNGTQDNANSDLFDGVKMGLIPSLLYFRTQGGTMAENITVNEFDTDSANSSIDLVTDGKVQELLLKTDESIFDADTFYMNKRAYLNYAHHFKKNVYLETAKTNITNGADFGYGGKPIKTTITYDNAVSGYFKNATKAYYPHFIVKTNKSNLILALGNDDVLSDVDAGYDLRTEAFIFKSVAHVDFKIANPYEVKALL